MQDRFRLQYILTLVVTLVALVAIVWYTFGSTYVLTKNDTMIMGGNKISEVAERANNYLIKSVGILEITGRTVDYMLTSNATIDEVKSYITAESEIYRATLDSNFTGIYGVFNHKYIDGLGWIPDSDYIPEEKIWYKRAVECIGSKGITAPYIDVQSRKIMISIVMMLSDYRSAIALDVSMDDLQTIIDEIDVKNNSRSFIVDDSGIVVAHTNHDERGKNYLIENSNTAGLLQRIYSGDNEPFEYEIDGETYIVFSSLIYDSWYAILVVDKEVLFDNVKTNLYRNIIFSTLIFLFVVYFCTTSYRNRLRAYNSERAKGVFLANMSHEIRTPINALLGMNELIMRESKEKNIQEYSANVFHSGEALLSLVNDILDFSKIESGKMGIVPVNYHLSSLITDSFNMVYMRAKEKGLTLNINVSDTIPTVLFGDEIRIRQIIINLLNNAVKYTSSGHIDLLVNWNKTSKKRMQLNVCVSDTGIGISEQNIKKLFSSFQRIDQVNNRNIEGTGLGLAISKQLLDIMGGSINVKSVYGVGSTFSFYVEQKIVDDTPLGEFKIHAKLKDSDHKSTFEAPNAKILVVDDVEMNLRVFKGLLKNTKISIDTALSGKMCLNLIREKKYDLIFMDHMMPEMDGIETLQAMKKSENTLNSTTPVIMLSANAVQGVDKEYISMGFNDYLSKPIKTNILENMIMKYLPTDMYSVIDTEKDNKNNQNTMDDSKQDNESSSSNSQNDEGFKTTYSDEEKKFIKYFDYIDAESGLIYCDHDIDFYIEVIESYIMNNKVGDISDTYNRQDFDNYAKIIAGIRGTSMSIGATNIKELAEKIEYHLNEVGDYEKIASNHRQLIKEYEKIMVLLSASISRYHKEVS